VIRVWACSSALIGVVAPSDLLHFYFDSFVFADFRFGTAGFFVFFFLLFASN
jgi:hypothetical protein